MPQFPTQASNYDIDSLATDLKKVDEFYGSPVYGFASDILQGINDGAIDVENF